MRILPLTRYLESLGFECNLVSEVKWASIAGSKIGNALSIVITHSPIEYIKTLTGSPEIVIVSKTSNPQMYLFQKMLKKKNIKFIFDITDATFLYNCRFLGIPIRPHSDFIERVLKKADCVTTNGHYLQNYSKNYNDNCFLINDPIDCDIFHPVQKNANKRLTIGWEGNPAAHYKNLEMLIEPLQKLSSQIDLRFKMVSALGDNKVKKMFKSLEDKIEVDYGSTRWLSTGEFAKEVSEFDIFLAPIQNTAWYEGKSALRVGIGMALGIPVIASPVGEQKYMVQHGFNGYLARSAIDWYKYLKMLVDDKELRLSMGIRGRQTANEQLSISVCGQKLQGILSNL
jgi:glycosyltransferase involved in cell wall biosynthesis